MISDAKQLQERREALLKEIRLRQRGGAGGGRYRRAAPRSEKVLGGQELEMAVRVLAAHIVELEKKVEDLSKRAMFIPM